MEPPTVSRTQPADLTLLEAASALRAGDLTAVGLLESSMERVGQRNGGEPSFDGNERAINAWARLYPESARHQAEQADERLAQEGQDAPLLCGIPLGLKDLYAVGGFPLTASSRVLEGNVAEASAPVVAHLRDQGMVLLGHTHMHEFAAGGSTDQVGNPWAVDRTAGGSSGGSAAALATGMVTAALGTDTAGSVRIPPSLCGVPAIKPSFNRVPMTGVIPLAPTLDHSGPMARTVADCAALLNQMSRTEPATLPWTAGEIPAIDLPVQAARGPLPLNGKRIAVTGRNMSDVVDVEIVDALEVARQACESLGATIVSLPYPADIAKADYDTILISEARSYHARYAERESQYRGSTRDFLDFGAKPFPVSAYLDAQQRRVEVTARWKHWFVKHGIDAVLEPTQAITAPPRGHGYDPDQTVGGEDPMTLFTALWNSTGFPVVTLPVNLGRASGLPTSTSLISGPGQEFRAVEIALALERYEFPPFRLGPSRAVGD